MSTTSAADRLERLTADGSAIPLSLFMAYANAAYYSARDPLGADGDFITAPEIHQMFGELIGLWCADLWMRAGKPPLAWAELGPGRGTLAADALRAMARFGLTPDVHLVETSPVLRDMQSARVGTAQFHSGVETLPRDKPIIVIANEFFDALPIRQLILTAAGWRERLVTQDRGRYVTVTGDVPMNAAVPPALRQAPIGSIVESSPASVAIARDVALTLAQCGGALLTIDYGYVGPAIGDTLQAVARHQFADVFTDPGSRDLTAHVDFSALAEAGAGAGLRVSGPAGQGAFLRALGVDQRAKALAIAHPARADDTRAAHHRLTAPEEMGDLFKVQPMTAPGWPTPEGFAG